MQGREATRSRRAWHSRGCIPHTPRSAVNYHGLVKPNPVARPLKVDEGVSRPVPGVWLARRTTIGNEKSTRVGEQGARLSDSRRMRSMSKAVVGASTGHPLNSSLGLGRDERTGRVIPRIQLALEVGAHPPRRHRAQVQRRCTHATNVAHVRQQACDGRY